jgi:hypothetical protein
LPLPRLWPAAAFDPVGAAAFLVKARLPVKRLPLFRAALPATVRNPLEAFCRRPPGKLARALLKLAITINLVRLPRKTASRRVMALRPPIIAGVRGPCLPAAVVPARALLRAVTAAGLVRLLPLLAVAVALAAAVRTAPWGPGPITVIRAALRPLETPALRPTVKITGPACSFAGGFCTRAAAIPAWPFSRVSAVLAGSGRLLCPMSAALRRTVLAGSGRPLFPTSAALRRTALTGSGRPLFPTSAAVRRTLETTRSRMPLKPVIAARGI